METVQLPYPVPYTAQIASPELANEIFEYRLPPEQDPRWAETGARSPQEYSYWVERACGVACVKMSVDALGGPNRPLLDWARAGVKMGGYLIEQGANGETLERGWIHIALARLCQSAGLAAVATPASLEEIVTALRAGQLVIASTSYEIGTNGPVTKRGGHLVVITGAEVHHGQPLAFFINNPSGRYPELQAGGRVPAGRFAEGYTGRIIRVWRESAP
ncbi:MAG TPA: C39 family peptidase [Anaerolineaceae bacterium]